MKDASIDNQPEILISNRFSEAGIEIDSLETKKYPDEVIYVVKVQATLFEKAAVLGNQLDHELEKIGVNGFVTVKPSNDKQHKSPGRVVKGVVDERATDLVNLIVARSRASESQPSLEYIKDSAQNILNVIAQRHHLIFGRRGAGKTSLLVEAKRNLEKQGNICVWINLQTHRHEDSKRAFLWICQKIVDSIQSFYADKSKAPQILSLTAQFKEVIEKFLSLESASDKEIKSLIPKMQNILKRFLDSSGKRLYIFIDDLHYLKWAEQPKFLDMIHGAVRDCDAWLKVAGIKHLSKWFQSHPPLGLQTRHDADHIDLDLTLENPVQAKSFLEKVLKTYAEYTNISTLSAVFTSEALDRLVLASGAVPRDYLILSSGAIKQAQKREKSKLVGVQDVNKAAGEVASIKLSELEDDAVSAGNMSAKLIGALSKLRAFCIDEKSITFFRIDFTDREIHPDGYAIMQELLDLRLVHLLQSSLSDEREAGKRSEVYMLDLSQFSAQRLKRQLRVLDFELGNLILKQTGTSTKPKIGKSPNQRLGILRRGPLLSLSVLEGQ